jgi:hypothetical protein
VAVVALAAVLWPLTRSEAHDSFPLSNYPMFTSDPPAVASFARALGVTTTGHELVLPPELAGGSVEVIHANRTLRRAVREGRAGELCVEIAERVRERPGDIEVVEVLIVVERYHVATALGDADPRPADRDVRARCPVDGASAT